MEKIKHLMSSELFDWITNKKLIELAEDCEKHFLNLLKKRKLDLNRALDFASEVYEDWYSHKMKESEFIKKFVVPAENLNLYEIQNITKKEDYDDLEDALESIYTIKKSIRRLELKIATIDRIIQQINYAGDDVSMQDLDPILILARNRGTLIKKMTFYSVE